ncbi:MAG TPA: hypothetical protein DEG88_11855 [Propionibacteriaceae bacterium]|nr:hypothetical protein [Propionibacteriaceae bacterium]HBY23932.1 hypothetical protein [Propionibacteriaceae bacterium]
MGMPSLEKGVASWAPQRPSGDFLSEAAQVGVSVGRSTAVGVSEGDGSGVVEPVGVATALGEGTLARGEPLMVIRGPGAVHPTTAKALIATPPRLRMATATRLLPTLRSP